MGAGRQPLGDGGTTVRTDVHQPPPAVGVVLAPHQHPPAAQIAHDQADRGRRDPQHPGKLRNGHGTVEQQHRLVTAVTEAIVTVFGERVRAGVTVDLVGAPAGRTGIGGVVVTS